MKKSTIGLQKYFFIVALIFALAITGIHADPLSEQQKIDEANWQIQQIAPGIILKQAQFETLFGVPQNVNIIEADLRDQNLKLGVAADTKRRILTSDFAKQHNAIAAINGTFFNMREGGSNLLVKSEGKIISDSKNAPPSTYGAITFDENNAQIIAANPQEKRWDENLTAPEVMISGPLLIHNSKVIELSKSSFNDARHPRSAVAITQDKKLLFIAVDGRHKEAGGMNLPSLSTFLKELGAVDALNLDGGGSTTLYANDAVVNHPSDNKKFDHHGERTVANALYISRK